jgi:hypothetical protein
MYEPEDTPFDELLDHGGDALLEETDNLPCIDDPAPPDHACQLKPKVLTSRIQISREDMSSYYSFWTSIMLPSMLLTNC